MTPEYRVNVFGVRKREPLSDKFKYVRVNQLPKGVWTFCKCLRIGYEDCYGQLLDKPILLCGQEDSVFLSPGETVIGWGEKYYRLKFARSLCGNCT